MVNFLGGVILEKVNVVVLIFEEIAFLVFFNKLNVHTTFNTKSKILNVWKFIPTYRAKYPI